MTRIDSFCMFKAFLIAQRKLCYFLLVERSERAKMYIFCFNILEPKCGPTKSWKFWSHGPPLTPPYPPWHPPGVRGGQKWPKCIPSSPLMIIYAKKAISGGSKKLTYFFTRNVPVSTSSPPATSTLPYHNQNDHHLQAGRMVVPLHPLVKVQPSLLLASGGARQGDRHGFRG